MAATAKALLPFEVWPSQIDAAADPANNNALRAEVITRPAISFIAALPGSPSNGDLHALSAAIGDEVAGTLAFYTAGAWTYWEPVIGMLKRIGTDYYTYDPDSSDEWQLYAPGGGAVDSVNGRTGAVVLTAADTPATIITDATTARDLGASDMGAYIRFTNSAAKALTVRDNADVAITSGLEVHGRNVGAGDLTITKDTAVTVNVPAGGTLVIPQGGTFTLKKVSTDEWDLFGVTVAA